ncbi:MAG TPA: type II toxin-antitoxin system VapB family antitoxin [Candidatus Paceibacterota bacterium]
MSPFVIPFAGITQRPYNQDFLSNVDRYAIDPSNVVFRNVWLCQKTLTIEGIFGKRYSVDVFPHVVLYRKLLYLEDGTHRLVLSALEGIREAPMRIIDWEKYNG